MKRPEVNCTISSSQSSQKCTEQDFGCLEPVLCLICHTEAFLYFLHKETLLESWICVCSMRKTTGSFQKKRGAGRPELTSFTGFPVCPGSSLQDLYIFSFFCSSFSSFSPSKLKNSLAIRKKNKTIAGCEYAVAQDPTCQKAML